MQNSTPTNTDENTYNTDNETVTDAQDENSEEIGYIESKSPDSLEEDNDDDDSSDDNRDEKDDFEFSKELMTYVDEITEKDEKEKGQPDRTRQEKIVPRTAEEEEIEILQSIPSERGRERIRQIMAARRQAEGRLEQNQQTIEDIKKFVEKVGVDATDIVKNLEYSRLLGKGDKTSLQLALDMLEDQREMICKRLNITRPGIDLLSDLPELKKAVERKEISMEHALKLARYERRENENRKMLEERREYDINNARFLSDLESTKHAIQSYLQLRSGEADHEAKVIRLYEHLKKPGVLQELTQNMDSRRWFSQLKFMYDNIVVPPVRLKTHVQPIRSKPTMQGPVTTRPNATMAEKIGDIIDSMGI